MAYRPKKLEFTIGFITVQWIVYWDGPPIAQSYGGVEFRFWIHPK